MSKRKSIGRRRSRSLVGFGAKDLCVTIPKSLEPAERLLMLVEISFHHALSTVQKEIMQTQDFDISSFHEKSAECWEKIRAIIEERKLCEFAVTENTLSTNSYIGNKPEEYSRAMARLEKEYYEWDKCIANYKKSLQEGIDRPCVVDASAWKDENQLFDYSEILKDTSSKHKILMRHVKKLPAANLVFRDCLRMNDNYEHAVKLRTEREFYKKMSQNSSGKATPRSLIRRIASSSQIIKHHKDM